MKVCNKCKRELDDSMFHRCKTNSSGYYYYCKECKKNYDKRYRQSDKTQNIYHSKEYRDRKSEYYRWKQRHTPEQIIIYTLRSRCKVKGIPFNLELSDINIPEFCPLLGIKLMQGGGKSLREKQNSPSVDRIIPELGYVKGNIMIISNRANTMKNDMSLKELSLFCYNMIDILNLKDERNINHNVYDDTVECSNVNNNQERQ